MGNDFASLPSSVLLNLLSNSKFFLGTSLELSTELRKEDDLRAVLGCGWADNLINDINSFRNALKDLEKPNQPLVIAVAGAFSAGKSTFINNLLGKNIAPVGASSTTQSCTRFLYSKEKTDRYVWNGQTINAQKYKKLSQDARVTGDFDVYIRAPILDGDVCILDMPGHGSDNRGNEIAEKAIKEADVILWLQPVKNGTVRESDLEFLQKVYKKTVKAPKTLGLIVTQVGSSTREKIDHVMDEMANCLSMHEIPLKFSAFFDANDLEDCMPSLRSDLEKQRRDIVAYVKECYVEARKLRRRRLSEHLVQTNKMLRKMLFTVFDKIKQLMVLKPEVDKYIAQRVSSYQDDLRMQIGQLISQEIDKLITENNFERWVSYCCTDIGIFVDTYEAHFVEDDHFLGVSSDLYQEFQKAFGNYFATTGFRTRNVFEKARNEVLECLELEDTRVDDVWTNDSDEVVQKVALGVKIRLDFRKDQCSLLFSHKAIELYADLGLRLKADDPYIQESKAVVKAISLLEKVICECQLSDKRIRERIKK